MNLAELIRTTKGDRSYDDLARDAGGAPGRQRWQQLASTMPLKNFPDPDSIRAIARALGVSQRAVVDAAGESLGLDIARGRSRFEELLPDGVDLLDDDAQAAVLAVLRALARASTTEAPVDPAGISGASDARSIEPQTTATAGADSATTDGPRVGTPQLRSRSARSTGSHRPRGT
ncbi:hypothetical protein ACTHAM_002390 [Cellulomonas soli]|uniref:hypothetical protein n=1 Tax=Cellulomonas soli TaxID=931535 RepID=UPI003F85EE2F